jgi:hypothetical protein
MFAHDFTARLRAIVVASAFIVLLAPAQAQQPSANAIALAKQIITVKGSANMFDPILPNLVDKTRAMLLQTNPMLSKDLNDVAAKVRTEMSPRTSELLTEMAKLYAASFTEQELKDALTFYKSAVGQKISAAEPRILQQTFDVVNGWSDKIGEEIIGKMRAEMKKKGHDL